MFKKWLARAADRSFALVAAVLMRQAVAPLLRMDETALHEAGLSRAAVDEFLQTPLATEPGHFFAEYMARQRPQSIVETAADIAVPLLPVAPELFLNGQRDARDGPSPRQDHRLSEPPSSPDLAKETS